jgi:hypothetical protein
VSEQERLITVSEEALLDTLVRAFSGPRVAEPGATGLARAFMERLTVQQPAPPVPSVRDTLIYEAGLRQGAAQADVRAVSELCAAATAVLDAVVWDSWQSGANTELRDRLRAAVDAGARLLAAPEAQEVTDGE